MILRNKKVTVMLFILLMAIGSLGCQGGNDTNGESSVAEATSIETGNANETKEDDNQSEVNEEVADSYYPITYTTYNYAKEVVEVTIDKAPEKVLAVYQNSIETLLALGLEDKIVAAAGLDHKVKPAYETAFSGVKYLDDWQPSKETVVLLEPDFILSWYSYFSEKRIGDVDYYHDNGIGTYMSLNTGCTSPRTLQNEIDDILTLGKIFNVNDRAEALAANITDRVTEVSELAKKEEQKSAILIEFFGDDIYTYGATSLGGDLVTQLGAELLNPQGDNIGKEALIDLDPDTIFVVYYNGGERTDEEAEQGAIDNVLNIEAFNNLSAVKNNKLIAIPLGEMYASGIRTIDGIERISDGIYK